jgi:hypothetical protein
VTRWTAATVARALVLGGVAFASGAALGYWVSHERAPAHGPGGFGGRDAAAGSPERALVAPLAPGSALGDFRVRTISAVERGTFSVVCERGRETMRLVIALDGGAARPAATAGPYAIFYVASEGGGGGDGARLAQTLATTLSRNLDHAAPPGLGRFQPER